VVRCPLQIDKRDSPHPWSRSALVTAPGYSLHQAISRCRRGSPSANIRTRMNDRLKRLILGDPQTIAGTVYGTIIVMSVIAASAKAYEHHLWRLVALAGGSAVILWLAHVYAHALGESLSLGRRITIDEIASIARREYAVIAAAIIPLVALALGATGLLGQRTAVQLALWLGVAVLAAQGGRYARLECLRPGATVATISLNLAIGLALVALEVLIAH
jgi:hypothetical protein